MLRQRSTGANTVPVDLNVNGRDVLLALDLRTTILDALRQHLDLTGTKKRMRIMANAARAQCMWEAAAYFPV